MLSCVSVAELLASAARPLVRSWRPNSSVGCCVWPVAELLRSQQLAQESWSLLACTAKNRVLRDAAALPPPDGSGGPFYALPHEMFTQILSGSVVSLKDYAHILRTCLLFNSAAVSKSVFAAVGKAAVSEARQEAEAADAAAQEARNKIAEAGERVDTHDMEPGALKLAHQTASTTRSGVYDAPGTWSAGTSAPSTTTRFCSRS